MGLPAWEVIESSPEYNSIPPDQQKVVRDRYEVKMGPIQAKPAPEAPPDANKPLDYNRGLLGDIGSHTMRGIARGAEMLGHGLELADLTPEDVDKKEGLLDKAGKKLIKWGKSAPERSDIYRPDSAESSEGLVKSTFGSAVESAPLMAAPFATAKAGAIAGGALGSFVPVLGPGVGAIAGGTIGGLAGMAATFFGGTYGESRKSAIEELRATRPDMNEDEIRDTAHKVSMTKGLYEAVPEAVSDVLALYTFGGSKILTGGGKIALKQLLKSGPKEMAKKFGVAYLKSAPMEAGTEMLTEYGQKKADADYLGKGDGATANDYIHAAGAAMWMSLGMGMAMSTSSEVKSRRAYNAINSEDKGVRENAAKYISGELYNVTNDQQLANQWFAEASEMIKAGEPIITSEPVSEARASFGVEKVEPFIGGLQGIEDPAEKVRLIKYVMDNPKTTADAKIALVGSGVFEQNGMLPPITAGDEVLGTLGSVLPGSKGERDVADDLASLLIDGDIESPEDLAARVESADEFINSPDITDGSKRRFINSGALEFLGVDRAKYLPADAKEGTISEPAPDIPLPADTPILGAIPGDRAQVVARDAQLEQDMVDSQQAIQQQADETPVRNFEKESLAYRRGQNKKAPSETDTEYARISSIPEGERTQRDVAYVKMYEDYNEGLLGNSVSSEIGTDGIGMNPERSANTGEAVSLPPESDGSSQVEGNSAPTGKPRPPLSIDPGLPQPVDNTSSANFKQLPDDGRRQSFFEKPSSPADIKGNRIVIDSMLRIIHNPEIRKRIVKLVPVDVMNYFTDTELTSKMLLHDISMLKDGRTVDIKHFIPSAGDAARVSDIVAAAARDSVAAGVTFPLDENIFLNSELASTQDTESMNAAVSATTGQGTKVVSLEGSGDSTENISAEGTGNINGSPSVDSGAGGGTKVAGGANLSGNSLNSLPAGGTSTSGHDNITSNNIVTGQDDVVSATSSTPSNIEPSIEKDKRQSSSETTIKPNSTPDAAASAPSSAAPSPTFTVEPHGDGGVIVIGDTDAIVKKLRSAGIKTPGRVNKKKGGRTFSNVKAGVIREVFGADKIGEEGFKTWFDTEEEATAALDSMQSNGVAVASHVGEAWSRKSDSFKFKVYRSSEEIDRLNKISRKATEEEAAKEDAKQAEKQAAIVADDFNGFATDKTKMQKGRIRKALEKSLRFSDSGIMTIRERIDYFAEKGTLEVGSYEENRIKEMSRKRYFRADQQEQDAHDNKVKEGGKKTVYTVNGSLLGKIAHDYAQHLLKNNTPKAGKSAGSGGKKFSKVAFPTRSEILNTDRFLDVGLKIGKKAKIYRGVSESSGTNAAKIGNGLYSTTDKKQAGKYGNVIELTHDDLPKKPIRFQDEMAFENWYEHLWNEQFGFRRPSDFEREYGSVDTFLSETVPDIDGVQIGTGHGAFFVKFPERGNKSSKTTTPTGTTLRQARRAARKLLGNAGYNRWKKEGVLNIAQSVEGVTGVEIKSSDGKVAGYYDSRNGSITLIADNIEPETVAGILLHEGGHRLLDNDPRFIKDRDKILSSFEALQEGTGKQVTAVKAAFDRARKSEPEGSDDLIREEAISYYLQEKSNRNTPIYRKILAAVKRALRRLGIPTGNLNADDIVGIFVAGIKRDARGATNKKSLSVGLNEFAQGVKKSYAGKESRTADQSKLFEAIRMNEFGEDAETIRQETGWHLGKDEKYRFEIDDSNAKFTPENLKQENGSGQRWVEGTLIDLLQHDTLYDSYPDLADVEVVLTERKGKGDPSASIVPGNQFGPAILTIYGVKNGELTDDHRNSIIHEVQHEIQEIEGFARGGSVAEELKKYKKRAESAEMQVKRFNEMLKATIGTPEYDNIMSAKEDFVEAHAKEGSFSHIQSLTKAHRDYARLFGEIEARDAAARKDLTAEQRKALPPYIAEGIPMDKAIVKFSKPDDAYQSMANTTTLNASIDGETSESSAEYGEKIMAEIYRKLTAVNSPTVRKRFSGEELLKAVESFRGVVDVIGDPHKSIAEKQKFAAGFAQKLPPIPRAKLLTTLSAISRVKKEKAKQLRLNRFLKRADKVLTEHLRRELIDKINDKTKPTKGETNGGVKTGRGAKFERELKYIREVVLALDSDADKASAEGREMQIIGDLEQELDNTVDNDARDKITERIVNSEVNLSLLEVLSNIRNQTFDELIRSSELMDSVLAGRYEWKALLEEQKARNKSNQSKVIKEITGEDNPVPEDTTERTNRKIEEQKLSGKVKEIISGITNMIQSWELELDIIAGKSGAKTLKSWTVKHFGSLANYATRDYEQMQMDAHDRIGEKAAEIFGAKPGLELRRTFAKLAKPVKDQVFLYPEGKAKAITISPSQAAYWYQISKDSTNQDMQATFDNMGITDETMKQIDGVMTPELKKWADYLVDDLYQEMHYDTNEVYKKMYGIDLTRNEKYVPWKRQFKGRGNKDMQYDGLLSGTESGSVKKGGLHQRTANVKTEFKVADLNDVLMDHIGDMNHFKAWALPSKEINGTFNDPAVKNFIVQHHGVSALDVIQKHQRKFTQTLKELKNKDEMRFLDRMRANLTIAMVGANPVVFLKQLSSIPAYAADIPVGDWLKHTAYAMSHQVKVAKILNQSTMIKSRYRKGFERDIANAQRRSGSDTVAGGKKARDLMMILVELGDRGAITIGGYAVYAYHLEKNVKAGMSRADAHKEAINEFEMSTERAQQSSNVKDLGWIQTESPFLKLFTMFMTTPASYTRQIYTGMRHLKSDPVDSAKRLAIYGAILPSIFMALGDAMLWGDDEDDEQREKFMENQKKGLFLAPFGGLPVIRTMAEGFWNSYHGKTFFASQYTPAAEFPKTAEKLIDNLQKYKSGGTKRIGEDEYLNRLMWNVAELAGYTTGVPVKPLKRIATGVMDAAAGDTDYPVRRSIGYSRSAVGEN